MPFEVDHMRSFSTPNLLWQWLEAHHESEQEL